MPTSETHLEIPLDYPTQIAEQGFATVENVVTPAQIDELRDAIAAFSDSELVPRKVNVFGIRNLLEISRPVRELAASSPVRALVIPILGDKCFAVRATFLDKVPDANWNLR